MNRIGRNFVLSSGDVVRVIDASPLATEYDVLVIESGAFAVGDVVMFGVIDLDREVIA